MWKMRKHSADDQLLPIVFGRVTQSIIIYNTRNNATKIQNLIESHTENTPLTLS